LENYVIQTALQCPKQVHAGYSRCIERVGHIAAELAFHHAIDVLGLLFLTQVNGVVRGPSAAAGHVAGRVAALLKGATGRETLVALQE
jgi:hypothetical protein